MIAWNLGAHVMGMSCYVSMLRFNIDRYVLLAGYEFLMQNCASPGLHIRYQLTSLYEQIKPETRSVSSASLEGRTLRALLLVWSTR